MDIKWGKGYGSKRHVIDPDRSAARYPSEVRPLAVCSPPADSLNAVILDWMGDDTSPDQYAPEKKPRTVGERVMSANPCVKCCRRIGLDPATV